MVRSARMSDLPQLKQIWKNIFHDTDSFISWQMKRRFIPELCAVCEEKERIVSCLYGYPLGLRFGEKTVENILVSGVSTLPEFRLRGLMTELFEFYLKYLYSLGVPLISLTPVNPVYYRGIGAVPLTESVIVSCGKVIKKGNTFFKKINISLSDKRLKACYESFISNYSCISVREKYFEIKMSEYKGENCSCIAAIDIRGDIKGYIVYTEEGGIVKCAEAVGDGKAVTELLSSFDLPFNATLPPDFQVEDISGNIVFNGNNSMGRIVSLKKFLEYFPELEPLKECVYDSIILKNNAAFSEKTVSVGEFLNEARKRLNLKPGFTTDFY